jgi:hypothetical protein
VREAEEVEGLRTAPVTPNPVGLSAEWNEARLVGVQVEEVLNRSHRSGSSKTDVATFETEATRKAGETGNERNHLHVAQGPAKPKIVLA